MGCSGPGDPGDPGGPGVQDDQPRYRVFFLTGAPLKVLSVRLHSKSHRKSFKCQNLLTEKTCDF